MQEALTYDDVLLVPQYSDILPKDTIVSSKFSKNISLKIPIVSSPMDTVTEHRMAIAMALEGGLGIIHKNLSPEEQAREVRIVKRHENGFIYEPVTLRLGHTVGDVHKIFNETGYKKFPVVDEKNALLGLVTELDFVWPQDKDKKVSQIMTPRDQLIIVEQGVDLNEANRIISEKKLSILCVIDRAGKLDSIVTRRDLEKNQEFPLANKDVNKHLYVGAALGVGADMLNRAHLLAEAGVDVFVLDSAHGHSAGIINAIKVLKGDEKTKKIDVVAGNVATKEGVIDLIKAGADGVKVGIGPGSICTTRIVAGIGVPQITAIIDSYEGLRGVDDIPLIADGGIKYSGDIVKALAAGAKSVMLGGLLAGAEESPGTSEYVDGRMYKTYRGMGSLAAMARGSKDRYGQAETTENGKFVPEGIEGRIPYRGPVSKIVYQLAGGLRAGLGYNGAKDIKDLQKKAKFIKITTAGNRESHPHDVHISKEAPNYSIN